MEMCVEGFWGTVCDSGFGREEALVLCRQLDMKSLVIYWHVTRGNLSGSINPAFSSSTFG